MRLSPTLTGTLLVAGATLLWGVNGTLSRIVMDTGLSPVRLAELRIVASAVVLMAYLMWRDRPALRLRRSELLPYLAFGGIGLVLVQWTYFQAIALMPISLALIIELTAPLMVAVWVRFAWKRRLPWVAWAAIPMALAGLVLALGVGGGDLGGISGAGVLWSIAAAFTYAYYALHAERLMQRRSPVAVLGIGLAVGGVMLLIALPWWSFPFDVLGQTGSAGPFTLPVWLACTYVVLFGTVVPFAMILAGVRRVGADGATITGMLEPIVAGAVAWVILGQVLTPLQILGGAIVLGAVGAAQLARARQAG